MKMKKMFLMFSMIAVLFSLSACSSPQEAVNFEYTLQDIVAYGVGYSDMFINMNDQDRAYIESEGDEVYKNGLSNFDAAADDCGTFIGFRSKNGTDVIKMDLSQGLTEDLQKDLNNIYVQINEENGNVVAILNGVYDKRDAEFRFVFEENPSFAYNEQSAAYKLAEVTVTPSFTTGEKMTKAGQNTLMGMGTVFAMLIFIALIISLFKYLDSSITKISGFFKQIFSSNKDTENVVTETKQVSATTSSSPVPVAAKTTDPSDDAELVAVITAAVVAANVAAGGSDKLVVRSIKKARR